MDQINKPLPKKPSDIGSGYIPSATFKDPFAQFSKKTARPQTPGNDFLSADLSSRDRTPGHVGSPQVGGIGEGSLSIRTATPPQPRISSPYIPTRVSATSSSANSSKRNSTFINIVSSEEEDDTVEVTPKKPRRSPPEPYHDQAKASARSSTSFTFRQPPSVTESSDSEPPRRHYRQHHASNTSSTNSVPRQSIRKFKYIEIPLKESEPVVPKSSIAIAKRRKFLSNLTALRGPRVSVVNGIDESSPSTRFRFVNDTVLGHGVSRAPDEVMIGCDCRKDNGRNIGCEYLSCDCLDDSGETADGRKVFPYSAAKKDSGCLRGFYLESRHHIYECNSNCNCEKNCKNRNVQHGRRVELEIFKTENRGWGLRCAVALRKGDFIDTYRGEIITVEVANKRGAQRSADEANYHMALDKFVEPEAITKADFLKTYPDKVNWHAKKVSEGDWTVFQKDGEDMWLNPEYVPYLYVCDGKDVGGPTRFMNHSCDPNCRLFTVSYNHSDPHVYDLAFFTLEEIPAGTELTFDYKDEDDRSIITHEQAAEVERRDGYRPQKCLCQTADCRQYFFN